MTQKTSKVSSLWNSLTLGTTVTYTTGKKAVNGHIVLIVPAGQTPLDAWNAQFVVTTDPKCPKNIAKVKVSAKQKRLVLVDEKKAYITGSLKTLTVVEASPTPTAETVEPATPTVEA